MCHPLSLALSHSIPSSLSIDLSLHPFLNLTPISSLHLSLPPSHSLPQGLFLQRQAEVSKEFSVFMTSELLTPKKIWNEVSNGTIQCCTTLQYIIQCCTTYIMLQYITRCCTTLHNAVIRCTALHYTEMYCTVLRYIALHCI